MADDQQRTWDYIDIVFDGPPAIQMPRLVEVENAEGYSVSIGQWVKKPNGRWALRITAGDVFVAVANTLI